MTDSRERINGAMPGVPLRAVGDGTDQSGRLAAGESDGGAQVPRDRIEIEGVYGRGKRGFSPAKAMAQRRFDL